MTFLFTATLCVLLGLFMLLGALGGTEGVFTGLFCAVVLFVFAGLCIKEFLQYRKGAGFHHLKGMGLGYEESCNLRLTPQELEIASTTGTQRIPLQSIARMELLKDMDVQKEEYGKVGDVAAGMAFGALGAVIRQSRKEKKRMKSGTPKRFLHQLVITRKTEGEDAQIVFGVSNVGVKVSKTLCKQYAKTSA